MKDQYIELILGIATILGGIAVIYKILSYILTNFKKKNEKGKKSAFLITVAFITGVMLFDLVFIYIQKLPVSHIFIRPLFDLSIIKPFPEMVNIQGGVVEIGIGDEGLFDIFNDSNEVMIKYRERKDLEELYRALGYPQMNIHIKNNYKISSHEVSFLEYDYYVWWQNKQGNDISYPSSLSLTRYNQPVVNLTISEVNKYTAWLSTIKNKTYRLPSEAEWEHAARAGTNTLYSWGNEYSAQYAQCGNYDSPTVVGNFPPNKFGLYDMSGNVWEMTCSKWKKTYNSTDVLKCDKPREKDHFVIRGGSFNSAICTSSTRSYLETGEKNDNIGFRVIQEL